MFAYDYQGRRVRKQVFDWDAQAGGGAGDWSATPSDDRRFVYHNWLLVMELDANNETLRKYTWGLDLSGLHGRPSAAGLQGAGGIGGLLACDDANGTPGNGPDDLKYVYFYDANGNVGQLVSDDGNLLARYEYDPYGNVQSSGGSLADPNPFRFSTKYFDAEIDYAGTNNDGLYYYGYRYYSPRLGRWLNRDPIGEDGGYNLYSFLGNTPPSVVDSDGQQPFVVGEPPRRCEPPSQDVTSLHDEPPDCFPAYPEHTVPAQNPEITHRPGWWWGMNPGCSKKYDYPQDCDWARTALSWPGTRSSRTSLLSSLTRILGLACVDCEKTGRPCDEGPPTRVVSDSQEVEFNTGGGDWFHAGIVRLKYIATCNMNVLCTNCNASCSITWQLWDGWHWGADPTLTRGCAGFYEFNWYITWYESVAISVPCRKSSEE